MTAEFQQRLEAYTAAADFYADSLCVYAVANKDTLELDDETLELLEQWHALSSDASSDGQKALSLGREIAHRLAAS